MRRILNIIGQAAGLLVLAAVLGAAGAAHGQIAADVAIMENLRDNHGFGQAFPGWSTTTVPCPSVGANWAGVTCSNNRVAIIAVGCGSTPLTAPFPGTEIAGLTGLISLEIRSCYFNPQPASNFAALDTMTQLTKIRLDFNSGITGNLSDVFPQGLSPTRFPALTTFQVEVTSLGGQIPAGVMEFSGSNSFQRLHQARFSGTLPVTGNPSKNLLINGNALEGVLPDYIRNATGGNNLVRLGYNKFDVVNTPAGTIDTIEPGWRTTQTVPPTNVQITQTGAGTATVSWTPIAYTAHGGYYEVLSSTAPGGPYTSRGTTAASGAKTATGLTVSGLPAGTNYFVVRTFTPAHTRETIICASGGSPLTTFCGATGDNSTIAPNNPNDLTSVLSPEASASVPPPLTVTKTADTADGTCDADCSLREAVAAAQSGDSIVFASPLFDTAQTVSVNGQITINKNLIIVGRGAALTTLNNIAPASATSRIFLILSGTVNLSKMSVTGGNLNASATLPGCSQICGGAIFNAANLTLSEMVFSGNQLSGSSSSSRGGGAIFNFGGQLTVSGTTFFNNSINTSSTFPSIGGALVNSVGSGVIVNSTFSNNSVIATSTASSQYFGGAIYSNNFSLVLHNTTVANNSVSASGASSQCEGGGISGAVTGRNLLVANNSLNCLNPTAPDVSLLSSLGNNFIGNTSGTNITGTTTGNILDQNPRLAPLGFYGGATPTHALTANSPAVNAGSNSEIQSVTPPASGTFRLIFNGLRTGNLAFDASPATVQAALIGNTLTSGAGAGNVSVTKPGASYIIAFQGTLADTNLPQIISTGSANDPIIQTIVDGKTAPTNDQRAASRVGALDIGAFELNNTANGGSFIAVLPTGTQNMSYNQQITANNGAFTYSVTGGALPNGVNLTTSVAPNAVVALTGTPTMAGTFDFAVTASDGTNSNVTNYRLQVLAPTAAGVSVSGRVSTADGRGLRNAIVTMTDTNGNIRSYRTGAFGYFIFDDVEVGQTYVFQVQSKRFQFAPQIVTVNEELTELNFTAEL